MHAQSAPVFVRNLNNLASMLAKAGTARKAKGDPAGAAQRAAGSTCFR